MDSFFARNRLSAYMDGTLPDAEAAAVADALARDPALQEEFDQLQRAVAFLQQHGPVDAPPGFHARVMQAVDAEPMPGGKVVWLRRALARVPVEAVALAAAAAMVVVVIQGRSPAEGPDEPVAVALPETEAPAAPAEKAQAQAPDQQEAAQQAPEQLAQAPAPDAPTAQAAAPAPQASKLKPVTSTTKGSGRSGSYGEAGKSNAPTQPYVPEWDRVQEADTQNAQAAMPDGAEIVAPESFRMTLADRGALYDLSALAEKSGGQLLDSSGRPLRARDLTVEENYAVVNVVVPAGRVDSVRGLLQSMGAKASSSAPSGALMGNTDNRVFVVEVSYQP